MAIQLPKNVVLFITDQERAIQHFPDGWEEQNLPGMTRLKANGLSFERAFTNACMCSPARSTLMTGFFPAQHLVRYTLEQDMTIQKKNPQYEMPVDWPNIARVMTAAGFNVVYKGKWHCSKPEGTEWVPDDLKKYGFERWNPQDAGANQDIDEAGGAPGADWMAGQCNNDERFMNDDGPVEDGGEGVLAYLSSQAAAQQPFFLIVSLVNPHDVLFYPKTYPDPGYGQPYPALGLTSWLDGEIDIPSTIDEDLTTKPSAQLDFLNISQLLGQLDTTSTQQDYLNFYGNLMRSSDLYLGQVLDALDALDLLDDTLIIRTADHGEMGLAHGGLRQKNFNFYEESIRVPLVYSNPVLYNGPQSTQALVSHVDFLPTIAQLFDAPASARAAWQGIDYSSLVLDPSAAPVQDYIVFTYDDYQSGQKTAPTPSPPNHIVSIREDQYKLAEYYQPDDSSVTPQWEMYDTWNNPPETTNIGYEGYARDAQEEAEFERLQAKLEQVKVERLGEDG